MTCPRNAKSVTRGGKNPVSVVPRGLLESRVDKFSAENLLKRQSARVALELESFPNGPAARFDAIHGCMASLAFVSQAHFPG